MIQEGAREAFIAAVTVHLSGGDPAELQDAFAEFGGTDDLQSALGLGIATVGYLVKELAHQTEEEAEEVWQDVALLLRGGFQ